MAVKKKVVKKKVVKKKKDDGIRAYFTGEDWKEIQLFTRAEVARALIVQNGLTKLDLELNDGEHTFNKELRDAQSGICTGTQGRITSTIMRIITEKLLTTPNT